MISVPIVSVWCASRRSPTYSVPTVATTPRNSIEGKKTEKIRCTSVACSLFAAFSSSNWRWNARSRLYACTTAIPETDSAI